MLKIELIVGLGNPGQQYENTRHNAGAWLIEAVAQRYNAPLKLESKYFGVTGRANIDGNDVRLLFPTTFMNRSGQGVAALSQFFKIKPENILVVHDELDLEPGIIRLKTGGGHGGHNGLRDIISQLGNNKSFQRLRLCVGHPGSSDKVTGYVLGKTPKTEKELIDACIDEAVHHLPAIVNGEQQKVMNELHRFNANEK
ncbi:MAG: aminoacyl-tRNA hydrolase [Pseudomonadales bacterium]|nr:aminoacyl-tRNA hydrolase [Pseudomonadales bacterium]